MSAEKIFIHGLGSSGESVGKAIRNEELGIRNDDEIVVFVEGALPGEEVLAEIETRKKNYAVGRLVEVLKKSSERVEPFCSLYKNCGGCQLQHMSYPAQLKWKRQQVVDAIERIGKLKIIRNEELGIRNEDDSLTANSYQLTAVFKTLGMKNPLRYRNKMQFPVGKNLQIGCYARGSHKIIDANACLIQNELNDKILNAVRNVAKKFNLQPYDEDTHRGFLRHVMGRVGSNGEFMIVLVTAAKNFPNEKNFVRALISQQRYPRTRHENFIRQADHPRQNHRAEFQHLSAFIFSSQHRAGRNFIQDRAGLRRTSWTRNCYRRLLRHGHDFSFHGAEGSKSYRRRSRKQHNIRNAEFFVGDAVKVLPKIFDAGVYAEVVVVDPPRAGCDKKVLETFAAMEPEKIIYVSCNPATLARDLKILDELGYRTKKIQPVDMFPFTSHVESVAQLVRK